MATIQLRVSDNDPYVYMQQTTAGSVVVGTDDNDNNKFKVVMSDAIDNLDPSSGSIAAGSCSVSIDPTANGNIEFCPKGSGQTTFARGSVAITGASSTAGNLLMNDTPAGGLSGVINKGGNRFIHNAGTNNTFVGSLAGNLGTTGNSSVAVGTNALNDAISLVGMTAIGFNALTALSAGIQNTAVGYKALASATSANQNTAVGYNSLTSLTSPSGPGNGLNVAVGNSALAASTQGRFNTAIGVQALPALDGNTNNDIFNTAVGCEAGWSMTTGINNTLIGAQAGVATLLGSGLLTGNNNVIVGAHSGENYTGAESNNIIIGNAGTVGDSARIRIGTSGTHTAVSIAGVNGVSVTAAGTVVIDASGQLGTVSTIPTAPFTWSVITADQTAAINNGYICNKASALVLTLPTTSAVGSVIEVTGINTALGWKVAQNASQQIFFGSTSTTSGATGFLQSTAIRDSIKMVCVVANLTWNVISSVGNITVS